MGNWPEYDRALVQRGAVTLWLAPEAITAWTAAGVGTRGGQLQYSDLAIETALTLRLLFHLPLRQTEGFLTSIFWMLDLDLSAPDHTTLSRRGQHLDPTLRRARADPVKPPAASTTVPAIEACSQRHVRSTYFFTFGLDGPPLPLPRSCGTPTVEVHVEVLPTSSAHAIVTV